MVLKRAKLLFLIAATVVILPLTLLANLGGFFYENCAAGFRKGQLLADEFPENLNFKSEPRK